MPKTKLFDADFLEERINTRKDKFLGTGHYCLNFRMTFEDEGKFYQVDYKTEAVEDQCDFEHFDGASEVLCKEVVPYEATVTLYRAVK